MSLDELVPYIWVVWAALILIFLVIEIFTVDFTFLMLAVGSVGGLVASLFQLPWFVQLLIAGALAIILIFTVRPPLLRALRSGEDPTKSNVDALIGLTGTVTSGHGGAVNQVKLANGETWTLRTTDGRVPAIGDRVAVTAIFLGITVWGPKAGWDGYVQAMAEAVPSTSSTTPESAAVSTSMS